MSSETEKQRKLREFANELAKLAVDDKKLVALGWLGYQRAVLDQNCSEIQINETRIAFYAGAQHLFATVMSVMDADREPTEADMRRMSLIHDELKEFADRFTGKYQ